MKRVERTEAWVAWVKGLGVVTAVWRAQVAAGNKWCCKSWFRVAHGHGRGNALGRIGQTQA